MKHRIFGIVLVLVVILGGVLLLRPHAKPATTGNPAPEVPYAALGDSVAAGLGLQPYSDPSACDRTDQSYPHQVAAALNLRLYNLACSGATIPVGMLGPQDVNNLSVPSQSDQLFGLPRPRAITVTVGANDIQWTTFLAKCYRTTCGTPDDTAALIGLETTLSANLSQLLGTIKNHYGTSVPPVILTGYYQVVPAQPSACRDLAGVDASEQAWERQQVDTLNAAIKAAAAAYPFVTYGAPDFSGHELCTTDPWVQGITDAAPYHPTAEGQTAYAKLVEASIRQATRGQKL